MSNKLPSKKFKKFPFKIDLERLDKTDVTSSYNGFWWPNQDRHREVVQWLNEYVGERLIDWHCHEAGYYHMKREEDAMAFKLTWL